MRDVYIVAPFRTAVGKSKRALANFRPEEMAAAVVQEVVARSKVPADKIEDFVLGCAFPKAEQGMNVARMIWLLAGLPDNVPAMTLNRYCSSGLESIAIAASKISAGLYDMAIAGGVETMSMISMGGNKFAPCPRLVRECPEAYISMGNCGDNVARDFNITRREMDEWAYNSVRKAVSAIDGGKFKGQIVPLEVPTNNGAVTFDTDEGPRRDTTLEGLAKLKPAFSPKGFCTAGNSSQTSDGAAAVLVAGEKAVKEYGLKPMGKLIGYRVGAASPLYLGPAQLEAIPKACEIAGIKVSDLGVIENNEAFASQCLLVIRELKLDPNKVNVNGGAIALGHPLGCTGAKLTTQVLHEMQKRGEKYGLVTMCIGGGMGAAGVFEACEN